jgi:hypothetical protein
MSKRLYCAGESINWWDRYCHLKLAACFGTQRRDKINFQLMTTVLRYLGGHSNRNLVHGRNAISGDHQVATRGSKSFLVIPSRTKTSPGIKQASNNSYLNSQSTIPNCPNCRVCLKRGKTHIGHRQLGGFYWHSLPVHANLVTNPSHSPWKEIQKPGILCRRPFQRMVAMPDEQIGHNVTHMLEHLCKLNRLG